MNDKKEQARHMYMQGSCTQRDIAKKLGVTERTVYNWIKGNSWERLRQAASAAPVMIAENLFSQLAEMQLAIAGREPGQRFPTMQEAEVTRKLVGCIEKMKKYPSLPQNMQVLASFRQFISPVVDSRVDSTIRLYADRFLEAEAKNGYLPYQVEFGVAPLLYEEDVDQQAQPEETGNSPEETHDSGKPVSPTSEVVEIPTPSLAVVSLAQTPEGDSVAPEVGNNFSPEILIENIGKIAASKGFHQLSAMAAQPEKTGKFPLLPEAMQTTLSNKNFVQQPKGNAPQNAATGIKVIPTNFVENSDKNRSDMFLRKNFPTRLSALRGENYEFRE
jgi:DNA-binding XRE family transcriptional regulator